MIKNFMSALGETDWVIEYERGTKSLTFKRPAGCDVFKEVMEAIQYNDNNV